MFISKLIPLKEALSKVEENISLMDTEVIEIFLWDTVVLEKL